MSVWRHRRSLVALVPCIVCIDNCYDIIGRNWIIVKRIDATGMTTRWGALLSDAALSVIRVILDGVRIINFSLLDSDSLDPQQKCFSTPVCGSSNKKQLPSGHGQRFAQAIGRWWSGLTSKNEIHSLLVILVTKRNALKNTGQISIRS